MKKVGRKVVSVLLTLCMLLTMLPVSALAADEGTVDTAPAETNLAEPVNTGNSSSDEGETPVSTLVAGTENSVDYVDEDGRTQTCAEYTTVAADTTTWSNGWYVVTGTVTLDDRVEVSDSVNLILADGAELNATKGIGVTYDNSLTIYGQSGGTGKLTAGAYQVYDSAAIGGTDDRDQNRNLCAHGDITINGGDITATGASAGIGGGESATGTSGTITINGGTVKATGGSDAAGIGGGYANTTNGGAIIINGGTVTATGGSKAAGIGAGYSGAGGMEITITGGKVTATGGSNDTYGGAGIGANYGGSTNPVSITITGSADVTATGGLGAAGIGGGSGNAEAAVDTIVIDGSAKVHATGGNQDTYAGAGIGAGGKGNCGSITIGGDANVTAIGGTSSSYSGAGIGAGGGNGGVDYVEGEVVITPTCNKINITGGTVDATGGTGADGIGGNASSTVESVSISGGTFTANTFPNGEIPADYLAAGFAPVKDSNGNWSVKEKEETPPAPTGVAQIGDKTYPTLEEAFAAVESSGTIKLLADTGISNTITISASQSIVLDLNGNTITELGEATRKICNNGTLTIRTSVAGGTLKNKDAGSYGLIDNYGTLTIESGTFENYGSASGAAIKNRPGAELLKIEGGEFKGLVEDPGGDQNGYATAANVLVASEAPLTITGGDFSSRAHYSAVFKIFADTADISNVTVSTYMAGGIEVAGGNAVLKDCSFHVSEENSYYANAVAVSGGGTATIDGGTYTGYKYAAYVYNSGGTINIEGGTFGAETVLKADNSTTSNKSVINVTKGDFTGNIAIGNQSTLAISGGTFSVEIPEEYCAEGFVPQKNADDTWGVVAETTYVAQIGETEYATLSEALNKVRDGETIKVLAPATVDTAVTYEITGKTITLNLNGQTVAWNTSAKEAITVKDSGSLTIQDTSANEAGELAFTSTYTAAGDSTGIYVNLNGALTLQSGTISYTAAKNGRAIYVGGTCTFAMSGGTVEIAGSAKYGVYLSSNNSTNITGGKIILSDTLTGTTLYGLYVYMLAEAQGLAIENLTVDASAVPVAQCAYCISGGWNNANNAPVTISGGTYTTNENTLSKAIYYSTVKNLTISGGTFNGVVDSATSITDGTFQKAVEVTDTITGGTFEGNVTAPSGKISGGKFKVVDPPYYWNLADGKSFEQKDGYYCVVDDTSGVAQIGNQKYETLEAAINAAQNGDTVKLIADVSMQDGILLDKGADIAITLDLNGYTYTVQEGANVSNRGFKINSGTLNVIDSSEEKTGEMVAVGSGTTSTDGAGAYGVFRVEANGHLNVTDVTLRNSRPWGLNVKICGGTATLTDVEIISSYGGGIEVTEANLGEQSQKGQATMTNCTVTQTGYFDHCSSAVSVSGGSKLIVNGGTYTSDGVAIYVFSSGGEIEVIDGTFSGKKQVIRAEIDTSTYPEYTGGVKIKGGSYTGNLAITSPASLAISGGTFSVEISEDYCAEGFKPVKNEQDNTWGVVEDTTIFESGSGTAEDPYIIMNATQLGRFRDSVNEGTNYQGQYIKLGADIDLSGMNWTPIGTSIALAFKGTFDGGDYVIENLSAVNNLDYGNGFFGNIVGPTAVIKNVTFDRAYVSRYSNNNIGGNIYGVVAAYAYGTVSFENVHVKNSDLRGYGKVAPILGMAADASGTTYLKDCTVENTTVYAVYNAAGLIGLAQNTVDLDNCTTTGVTGVLCDQPSSYVDLDVIVNNTYAGTQDQVQGKYLVDTTSLPGVTLYYAAWSDLYNDYYYGSLDAPCYIVGMDNHAIADGFCHNAQAQIGTTKYDTLEEAINAAVTGDTVKLLANVEQNTALTITNKSITLDLNGKKITGTNNSSSAFNYIMVYPDKNNPVDTALTITDTSVGQTGSIELTETGNANSGLASTYSTRLIYNTGSFTLQGGTLKLSAATSKALAGVYSFGSVSVEGGTIEVTKTGTASKWAVYGVYQASPTARGDVSVSGGTIKVSNEGPQIAVGVHSEKDSTTISGTVDIRVTGAIAESVEDTGSISGGTFFPAPAENLIADGYEIQVNEDGIASVVKEQPKVAEVDGVQYATLTEAINAASDGQTIKLLANSTGNTTATISDGRKLTLDMNGFNAGFSQYSNISIYHGGLNITGSGKLYEEKPYFAPVVIYGSDAPEAADYTTVTVGKDVTLEGWSGLFIDQHDEHKETAYGIKATVKGTLHSVKDFQGYGGHALYVQGVITATEGNVPEIILDGATLNTDVGNGMYLAGYAKTTITNSTITSTGENSTGIEIRAGKLTISGNTTVSGGKGEFVADPNGNGSTTNNVALAVVQHTTKLPVIVTVEGGTFNGGAALYQADEQDNGADAVAKVQISVEDGTFNGVVYSENKTNFITGGTFSEKPDEDYCAEGYAPEYDAESGTWDVVKDNSVAEIVGGEKYESLIDAVNAAKVNGQTVKLLADVELKPIENQDYVLMIDVNQSMTLDLNGHKITATLNNTKEFNLIKNYGELTITDTSEGKNGSIEVTENGSAEKSRTSVIYNGYSSGKFTLEAGTLKLTGSEGSKKPLSGVYSSGTTMVMNGGAIEVRRLNSYSEYSKAWDVYGIYNSNNCQTTVNGGKITVENQGRYNSAYGINNASGTVSIHGDPNTPYIEANAFDDGTWYEHTLTGKITLYGGKYNMQNDTATGWIENKNNITIAEGYEKKFNGDRTVSIVKSPVAQIGSTKYDTLEEALEEAKSGDTIKLLQNVALTDRVIISKNITLNLNDKTISSTADYAFIVNTGNSFTLENGTLSAYQNGVFGLTSSTVTLASDATINAGAAGITATNNLLEQGNATINVYGTIHSQDIAVWSQGPKNTINIDSATITSKYFGVYQNGSYGGTTITIKNSTITDESENGTGIYVSNNGTNAENPDQGFQNLIIENSTITGNTAVEVKFTNVTISGDDTCLTATGTPVDSGMNNNGSVTTGYAFAVTHNGTESSKDAAKGTVTISGGKFTGAVGIQEPSEGETTSATISISGGSFSEKPNKDYLAPHYEATQNTTGDNYWTVDVAANVEAIWITDTAEEAGMLSDLLGKATSGTVQLLKNVTTTGYVTVGTNVTLDLAGKTLDTTNSGTFSVFGKVVDSTEGKGLLKLQEGSYTIQKDNPSLPIYDSTVGGYRLYTYQLTTLQTYEPVTANTVQFWFKLTFTNEDAWELLKTGNENHGITVKSKYQFSGQTASESWLSFNSKFIHWIADQVVSSKYTQDKLGFYLNVTNTNLLGERTMTVTPAVDSVPSVGTESKQMTYSLNLEE